MALATAGALIMSMGLVWIGALTTQANADEPCVPKAAWTEIINHPAETTTVKVVDKAATEGYWTEWVNDGDPIRTEENAAPGANTDTVRYIGPTATSPETISEAQHYSWKGGPIDKPTVPPTPLVSPDDWQGAQEQESHTNGSNDQAKKPDGSPYTDGDTGLHYTDAGPGKASWFFFVGAVTDTDYLWQKQVRSWVPGQPEQSHNETVVVKQGWTETINHPAVTCDDTPPPPVDVTDVCPNIEGDQAELPDGYELVDGECAEIAGEEVIVPKPDKPEPKPDKKPTVKGVQAVAPPAAAPAAAPTAVAAGLGTPVSSPMQTAAQMLVAGGMLLLMAGAWIGLGRRETGTHEA